MKSDSPQTGSGGKIGFTVVELLVAIAIVAVLTSLLFGVYASSKDKANATACANNLRQCGVALRLYANEHQGHFPAALEADSYSWPNALAAGGYLPRLVAGQRTVVTCPGSATHGRYVDFRRVYGMWAGNASYGTLQFSRDIACYRLSAMSLEADRIVMADSGRSGYQAGWDPSYFIMSGTGKREPSDANKVINLAHAGTANALFADGHVQALTREWLARDGRYNWTANHP